MFLFIFLSIKLFITGKQFRDQLQIISTFEDSVIRIF